MTTDIISTITDEVTRQRATQLAAQHGWSPDLAALAVLSGNETAAVGAIGSALKQAAAGGSSVTSNYGAAKDKAEIALLQQKIDQAKRRLDTDRHQLAIWRYLEVFQ